MENIYDVLIIGCGPCGITMATKLKETHLKYAVIEGSTPGGKVNIAPRVDNFPGYFQIPGPQLAMEFFKKVTDNQIEVIYDQIEELIKENDLFKLQGSFANYYAKKVVIATGTKEKKIGLEKEDAMLGHGLSYCAICDGHFFKGKDIVVIGGEEHALKEAIYLARIGRSVNIVHNQDGFLGNEELINELKTFDNVSFITPYIPLEILGEEKVVGIRLQNVNTKEEKVLSCDGLFPLVGQIPNSSFVKIPGVLDEKGFIPVDEKHMSKCPHLYAGGDILPRDIKLINLAVKDGNAIFSAIIE